MRLITYISPRVAIWRAFCPPLYTAYNNSHSRKELCTRISAAYPPLFPFAVPPQPSPVPPVPRYPHPPPVCPALSLAVSSALFRSSALLSSLCGRAASKRARPVTFSLRRSSAGFLRRYRESFRVRLRATDYRNQAAPWFRYIDR